MNASLATGYPLRGGMAFAPGILNEGEIFGAALAEAYELETSHAEYPRVVIGDRLVDFLSSHLPMVESEDLETNVLGGLAAGCLSLVGTDTDGRSFLDSFGQGAASLMTEGAMQDSLIPSIEFAKGEYSKHSREGNAKLKARYFRLINYLESRFLMWENATEGS